MECVESTLVEGELEGISGEWRAPGEIAAIRHCTHTGRPLGTESFVRSLEDATQRRLPPLKGGRPKGVPEERRQATLGF
jgi:hypothetical protein